MTAISDDLERASVPTPTRGRGLLSTLAVGGAAIGAVAGLWASSLPGSSLLLVVGAVLAWVIAGILWLLLIAALFSGRSREASRPRMWGAVVAPILVVATVGLVALDAPLGARWAFSKDAFETVVGNTRGDLGSDQPVGVPAPRRLGAYRVAEAYQLDDGVFFVVSGGGGMMSAEGFAHLPTGPNAVAEAQYEGVKFQDLGDDWYVWNASI